MSTDLTNFRRLAGLLNEDKDKVGFEAERRVSDAHREAVKIVGRILEDAHPSPGYWQSAARLKVGDIGIWASMASSYTPIPGELVIGWGLEPAWRAAENRLAAAAVVPVIKKWATVLGSYGETTLNIKEREQFARVSVSIPVVEGALGTSDLSTGVEAYLKDLDGLAKRFGKMAVDAVASLQESAIVEAKVTKATVKKLVATLAKNLHTEIDSTSITIWFQREGTPGNPEDDTEDCEMAARDILKALGPGATMVSGGNKIIIKYKGDWAGFGNNNAGA